MKIFSYGVLAASISCFVSATVSPTYPEPGTVWRSGQVHHIVWSNDEIGTEWNTFKIDFMTGDNHQQKFLTNVATDIDATSMNFFNWTAPEVEPHASVYFFMFTNEVGEHAWTTRFGITGSDGKLVSPEYDTQPDGAKISWGVGRVLPPKATVVKQRPTAVYSMTPAQSSVAAENAALVIAVSSATKEHSGLAVLFTIILTLLL